MIEPRIHLDAARSAVGAGDLQTALQHISDCIHVLQSQGVEGADSMLRVVSQIQQAIQRHTMPPVTPMQSPEAPVDSQQLDQLTALLSHISIHTSNKPTSGSQIAGDIKGSTGSDNTRQPTMPMQAAQAVSLTHRPSTVGLHTPILQETGRDGLAECALNDGSHYVCPTCGGVVPVSRALQHSQYWCQAPVLSPAASPTAMSPGYDAASIHNPQLGSHTYLRSDGSPGVRSHPKDLPGRDAVWHPRGWGQGHPDDASASCWDAGSPSRMMHTSP